MVSSSKSVSQCNYASSCGLAGACHMLCVIDSVARQCMGEAKLTALVWVRDVDGHRQCGCKRECIRDEAALAQPAGRCRVPRRGDLLVRFLAYWHLALPAQGGYLLSVCMMLMTRSQI